MSDTTFLVDLIKGKIVETIFQQMFEEAGQFTVIPLGYENIVPELAQYQHILKFPKVIENIRKLPDFVLINKNKTSAYFVEVKYKKSLNPDGLVKDAKHSLDIWDPEWLFVASKSGFYFAPCNKIINENGNINILEKSWANSEIQNKYLSILNTFIG